MTFSLESFGSAEAAGSGATMHVVHPSTGGNLITPDGVPITITLAGPGSKQALRAQDVRTGLHLKARAGRPSPITAQELREDVTAIFAACTLAWTGIALAEGPLECTPANARKAYNKLPWLRDQVEKFFDTPANFMPQKPPSVLPGLGAPVLQLRRP